MSKYHKAGELGGRRIAYFRFLKFSLFYLEKVFIVLNYVHITTTNVSIFYKFLFDNRKKIIGLKKENNI